MACGPERAEDVRRLTQAAFERYRTLEPPSEAGGESEQTVREALGVGGGAVAELDEDPVGCLRWFIDDDTNFRVRRLAVRPERQRRGVGRALMAWAEDEARRRRCGAVALGVRLDLAANLAFYRSLGYESVGERRHHGYGRPTWLVLHKALVATP